MINEKGKTTQSKTFKKWNPSWLSPSLSLSLSLSHTHTRTHTHTHTQTQRQGVCVCASVSCRKLHRTYTACSVFPTNIHRHTCKYTCPLGVLTKADYSFWVQSVFLLQLLKGSIVCRVYLMPTYKKQQLKTYGSFSSYSWTSNKMLFGKGGGWAAWLFLAVLLKAVLLAMRSKRTLWR